MSALLSHALIAFTRECDAAGGPALVVWSNVLRLVADGIDLHELPSRAVLSKRAVRISVKNLEREGLLALGKGNAEDRSSARRVVLTSKGRRALEEGRLALNRTEESWESQFGASIDQLRQSLGALLRQVDVELPHYITSYGQGDVSMTGGGHRPEQHGPPRIPAHGEEWPVVLRDRETAQRLPLPALISETLTAFTIDYDTAAGAGPHGGLHGVVTFFARVDDDGIPLGDAREIGDITGTGRSALERHHQVVVEPGKSRDPARRVYLTSSARQARDAYPTLAFGIENQWRQRFGASLVDGIRESVEQIDKGLDDDLPDYPSPSAWLRRGRG